ncbi:MAG: leucine-rich repeat domain-containing protein [Clostridia bacterium]|nr:leucine-rich repeat domain-containing protein [Clostridia bacterium]
MKLGKNVNDINSLAFAYNYSLKNIVIDDQNPIYTAENGAIYTKDRTKLVSVVNIDTKNFEIPYGVTSIGERAFIRKMKLESVILPETIEEIGIEAFRECEKIEKIEIPTAIERIKENAFSGCTNLREIVIRKSFGSVEGMPWGCIYGERAIKWIQ